MGQLKYFRRKLLRTPPSRFALFNKCLGYLFRNPRDAEVAVLSVNAGGAKVEIVLHFWGPPVVQVSVLIKVSACKFARSIPHTVLKSNARKYRFQEISSCTVKFNSQKKLHTLIIEPVGYFVANDEANTAKINVSECKSHKVGSVKAFHGAMTACASFQLQIVETEQNIFFVSLLWIVLVKHGSLKESCGEHCKTQSYQ